MLDGDATLTLAALLLAIALAATVAQGMNSLSGSKSAQRLRGRREGESDEEWLLGPKTRDGCVQGLPGLRIKLGHSAAAVREWEADTPPPLDTTGPSHAWGWLPRWLLPDIVIRPEPTAIAAPPAAVWDALVDFDRYPSWNPFHRKVEIVAQGAGQEEERAVRMTVAMGPLLGEIVSTETLCYVDSRRHILMYSARHPSALRMAWLESAAGGRGEATTVFHSFDMIGGFPALFSRGHIVGVVYRGFTAQHEALKAYCEKGQ
jgi:hypothetical protein